MVTQRFEFYGRTHDVHLVQRRHKGTESLRRAGFYVLVAQQVVGTRGALCHKSGEFALLFGIEHQYPFADIIIHMVEVDAVAQISVQAGHAAVHLPVIIPITRHSHAYKHNPPKSHRGIGSKLPCPVGQVALAYLGPQVLDVGSHGEVFVHTVYRDKVTVQVIMDGLLYRRKDVLFAHIA